MIIEDFYDNSVKVFHGSIKYNIKCKLDMYKWIKNRPTMELVNNIILEFGVYKGVTINLLADLYDDCKIFGFDSFDGLPEEWHITEYQSHKKGHFKCNIPNVPKNVNLIRGWFEDTLPDWKNKYNENCGLIHIDSDLYSSAKYILRELNNLIIPGTIIIFDELCDWRYYKNNTYINPNYISTYANWKSGEYKALVEWIKEFDRKVIPICRTSVQQGAIIVEK